MEAAVPPLRLAGKESRGCRARGNALALANKMPFENKSGGVWVSHNSHKHTAPVQEQPAAFHCRVVVTVTTSSLCRPPPPTLQFAQLEVPVPITPARHWGRDCCPAGRETEDSRKLVGVAQGLRARMPGRLLQDVAPTHPWSPLCQASSLATVSLPRASPHPGDCPPLCLAGTACALAGHEIRIGFSDHGFSPGHLGSEQVCEDRAEAPWHPPATPPGFLLWGWLLVARPPPCYLPGAPPSPDSASDPGGPCAGPRGLQFSPLSGTHTYLLWAHARSSSSLGERIYVSVFPFGFCD